MPTVQVLDEGVSQRTLDYQRLLGGSPWWTGDETLNRPIAGTSLQEKD
jgi:hypothetical protein